MFYKRRELRRLWEVQVYVGDPDTATETRTETIIAWNEVDAIRHVGGAVVARPKALFFVTWPEDNGTDIYRIEDTEIGPIGDPIRPSVSRGNPDEQL